MDGLINSKTIKLFFQKVLKTQFCWIWVGAKTDDFYGRVRVNKRSIGAYRLSYLIHIGPIQEGLLVCHKCDNPMCVNPDHLFVGSMSDNIKDCVLKKRHGSYLKMIGKKECGRGHEWIEQNIYSRKNGKKECLICKKMRRQKHSQNLI